MSATSLYPCESPVFVAPNSRQIENPLRQPYEKAQAEIRALLAKIEVLEKGESFWRHYQNVHFEQVQSLNKQLNLLQEENQQLQRRLDVAQCVSVAPPRVHRIPDSGRVEEIIEEKPAESTSAYDFTNEFLETNAVTWDGNTLSEVELNFFATETLESSEIEFFTTESFAPSEIDAVVIDIPTVLERSPEPAPSVNDAESKTSSRSSSSWSSGGSSAASGYLDSDTNVLFARKIRRMTKTQLTNSSVSQLQRYCEKLGITYQKPKANAVSCIFEAAKAVLAKDSEASPTPGHP